MTGCLDLALFQLSRPEKVRWRANIKNGDVLASLRSKSLRKFLNKADDALTANNITYEYHQLTKDEYVEWLAYYRQKMTELGFSIIAREELYDERIAQGKTIEGMFFTQHKDGHSKLVGSGIFILDLPQMATFAFKASDHIEISKDDNSSLGVIIDYFFLREMVKRNVKIISAGRSGNAFGFTNTIGYPIYKLRFSYLPAPAERFPIVQTLPMSEKGITLCYALDKDQKLGLYAFYPEGTTPSFEHHKYATPELPFTEVPYTPDQLITCPE